MPLIDLTKTINVQSEILNAEDKRIIMPAGYCTPGFWAVVSSLAKSNNITKEGFVFQNEAQERYASAMDLCCALGGDDDYPHERVNKGTNYSTIAHLARPEETDEATSPNISSVGQISARKQGGEPP